jgi:phosphotransferase system HPr-like phosphotransfer protein
MQDGKATIKGENGEKATIQADKQGNSVSITSTDAEGNKVEYKGGSEVDLAKLGIEVYPGATQEQGGTVEGADMTMVSVALTTTDPFDKVQAFYQAKYPNASGQTMTASGKKSLSMQILDPKTPDDVKMIVVGEDEGKVTIALQHHAKKDPTAPK